MQDAEGQGKNSTPETAKLHRFAPRRHLQVRLSGALSPAAPLSGFG